jgi:hypothetical protein
MDLLGGLIQVPGVQKLWRRVPVGSVEDKVRLGIFRYPHYAWAIYSAARQAKNLGLEAISVIEFGVAGGRGLVALEHAAREISARLGVRVDVWGFDAEKGLPKPIDFRDLPHVWEQGDYQMDVAKLKAKLSTAKLVLGNVSQTVIPFLESGGFPPIGFVSFDLDYYSSTVAALKIFEGAASTRLPRVCCYFDDMIWPEDACHNEFAGEFLAIREFNEQHESMKLCKLNNLRWMMPYADAWQEEIYYLHDFSHPLYTKKLTPPEQLPL